MSKEGPSGRRREGDENFTELVKAMTIMRDRFLAEKHGMSVNPVEALVDWGEVTSSWRNKTGTCV